MTSTLWFKFSNLFTFIPGFTPNFQLSVNLRNCLNQLSHHPILTGA